MQLMFEGMTLEKPLLLVFMWDAAGHYLRCLELAKRLNDTFQIKFAYSSRYEKYIEEAGFKTFDVMNFNIDEVNNKISRVNYSWIKQTTLEDLLYSHIEAIEKYRPDIVLGDESFPLKMAAEKTKTRFVSLINGCHTKYYKLVRAIPQAHWGKKFEKLFPVKIWERIYQTGENYMLRKVHTPFRRIRKELGLSPQNYLYDEFEGDINLICDLPELFPQKEELPVNYHFIGPLYYKGHESEEEILNFLGDHHPNILVSMGSTSLHNTENLFNNPVFKKYKIVIASNKNMAGSNILNKPFINNIAIMNKIDLAICHGGNGTIYQALSHRVPVLCITSNVDQEWNAQRIDKLGLGALVKNENPEKIAKLIDLWIERAKTDNIFTNIKERINWFSKQPILNNISI